MNNEQFFLMVLFIMIAAISLFVLLYLYYTGQSTATRGSKTKYVPYHNKRYRNLQKMKAIKRYKRRRYNRRR